MADQREQYFPKYRLYQKILEKYKNYNLKYKSDVDIIPLTYEEFQSEILKKYYKNIKYLDVKTEEIAKKLFSKYKENQINRVDLNVLALILKREINYDQILREREKVKNPLYFLTNYIFVKNLTSDANNILEKIKENSYGDLVKFVPYPIQYYFAEKILSENFIVAIKSRQVGFSAISLLMSLQLILTHDGKYVNVFSKNENHAKENLYKFVKFPYENLPFYLRRRIYKNNQKMFALGTNNSSFIISNTSSKKSGRGGTSTWLILDEAEFIDGIEELQASAAPTLSTTGGKAIVLSTPYKVFSWFQKLTDAAKNTDIEKYIETNELDENFELQENYNINTKQFLIEAHWTLFEDRDLQQYETQKTLIKDPIFIKTELDMQFILPHQIYCEAIEKNPNVIYFSNEDYENNDFLKTIAGNVPGIQFTDKELSEDLIKNKKFLISVDPYEGGNDYNAVTIIDIEKCEIVATQKTKLENLSDYLMYLSEIFNNAKIVIERNRGYKIIRDLIENKKEHLLLPEIKQNGDIDFYIKGVFTDKKRKNEFLSELCNYVNDNKKITPALFNEMKYLVVKNRIEGLKGDDLCMSAGIGIQYCNKIKQMVYILQNDKSLKKEKKMQLFNFINFVLHSENIYNKNKNKNLENIDQKKLNKSEKSKEETITEYLFDFMLLNSSNSEYLIYNYFRNKKQMI